MFQMLIDISRKGIATHRFRARINFLACEKVVDNHTDHLIRVTHNGIKYGLNADENMCIYKFIHFICSIFNEIDFKVSN